MSEKHKSADQSGQDLKGALEESEQDEKRLDRLKRAQASLVKARVREALKNDSEIEVLAREAKDVAHELHLLRLNITKKGQHWITLLSEIGELAITMNELHAKEKFSLDEQWEIRLKRSLKEARAEARIRRELGLPME